MAGNSIGLVSTISFALEALRQAFRQEQAAAAALVQAQNLARHVEEVDNGPGRLGGSAEAQRGTIINIKV